MSTLTSTIREVIGVKKTNTEEEKSPDEKIKEYLDRQKEEMLARARLLELEELVKKKELAITELDSKIEALRSRGTGLSLGVGESVLPKLSKEEMEVVKLLLEMKDEDRVKALQMLMLLKGGGMGVVPFLGGSRETSVKDLAETLNALISAVKSVTPGQSTESALLQTLVSKLIEMAEKRPREEQSPLNEALNALVKYALEQLVSPRESDLDYMTEKLPKLIETAARIIPQQSGTNPELYKAWLELKRLDQEYEKWKAEMEFKRRSEEQKIDLLRSLVNTFEPGKLVKSALDSMLQSSRGQTSLPTILCDPKQGGCGSVIPIPPGVSEVVCARCGSRWRIGSEEQASQEGSGAG
jgi:hypothetical protein